MEKPSKTVEGSPDVTVGDFGRTMFGLIAVTIIGQLLPNQSAHVLAMQRVSCIHAVSPCNAAIGVCYNGRINTGGKRWCSSHGCVKTLISRCLSAWLPRQIEEDLTKKFSSLFLSVTKLCSKS